MGLELAGNGFNQILQRDNALHFAVLVDHEGHLLVRGAKVVQQLHAGNCLRHIERGLKGLILELLLALVAHRLRQPLAGIEHANHIVHIATHHGIARMVGLLHAPQIDFQAVVNVQADHVATRHHERANLAVIESKHIAHHGVLLRLDHACGATFHQNGLNLFFRHGCAAVFLDAQQLEQAARGCRQQPDKRLGGQRQKIDGARDQPRKGFGVGLAHALGHQLTDHDGEVRNQHHDQAGGEVTSRLGIQACLNKPLRQRPCQCGLAHDAVEHANRGDTNLNGGEKTCRVFTQFDSSCRAAVALIHQFLHAGFAGGDQRNFRHGEQTVQTDESEKYGYFHSQAPPVSGAKVIEQA